MKVWMVNSRDTYKEGKNAVYVAHSNYRVSTQVVLGEKLLRYEHVQV